LGGFWKANRGVLIFYTLFCKIIDAIIEYLKVWGTFPLLIYLLESYKVIYVPDFGFGLKFSRIKPGTPKKPSGKGLALSIMFSVDLINWNFSRVQEAGKNGSCSRITLRHNITLKLQIILGGRPPGFILNYGDEESPSTARWIAASLRSPWNMVHCSCTVIRISKKYHGFVHWNRSALICVKEPSNTNRSY
jgi:hypothetical protein